MTGRNKTIPALLLCAVGLLLMALGTSGRPEGLLSSRYGAGVLLACVAAAAAAAFVVRAAVTKLRRRRQGKG